MPLKTIFEPGDTIYYPNPYRESDKPMTVKDYYLGQGNRGPFVQYLTADLIQRLVEEMRENIENHYDNLVVITGHEGTGKSNCAYAVCKAFDPDFSINDGYIYDIGPFLEKLTTGDVKGKVFWFDEATNIASNRDWMKDSNKSLIQLLEMLRSYGMSLVMCIPKLERIDVYIRESRMRYHLNCADRYWENDSVRKRGYFELKRWPKFRSVCWGTFPRMPEEESKIYEALKAKSQREKSIEIYEKYKESNEAGGSKLKKAADNNRKLAWILIRDGYTYSEIEEETGIPAGTLRRWIHEEKEEIE